MEMKDSFTIKNKIKVFISSRCGKGFEKYDEVRRELKKLIESSQIAYVYIFEGEGSSTLTAEQDYLYAIDDSDVCIFLIDNYDGVTPAIVKEIQRAKSHPKKSLFLFCNEKEKKPTPIQEELTNPTSFKYYVVNNFQDFIKHGYQDLMNDIVKIYKLYCRSKLKDIEFNKKEEIKEETNIILDSIPKQNLKGLDKSKSYIGNLIYPMEYDVNESSTIDDYIEKFLRVLWGEKDIKDFNLGLFLEKLGENQDKKLNEIVKLRWKAIESYWLNNLDLSEKFLKDALNLSKINSMPDWFKMDILIDLRNIEIKKYQMNNMIIIETNAQKEINQISKVLFYPVIDRVENQLYEELYKDYKKDKTASIYSVTLGSNFNFLIEYLVKIFVTACYYGSLTHILLLRERIKDVVFHFCEKYDDWIFRVTLLKLSMITDESDKIKKYISLYNNILGKISAKDAIDIYNFTNSIPLEVDRFKAELEIFKYLGYFFSDEDYKRISTQLLTKIDEWIEKEYRIILLGDLILSAVEENRYRIDSNLIVDICLKILNKKIGFGN